MTANPETTLAQFIPIHAANKKLADETVDKLHIGIRKLDAFYGKPVRLCDLNEKLVSDWVEFMRRQGRLNEASIDRRRRMAITLWNAAFNLGILDVRPLCKPKRAKSDKKWTHRPSPDKRDLYNLFFETYQPTQLVGCSPGTTHQHLVQLRHFERFLGRRPTLDDLTDETVGRWLMWLMEMLGQKRATASRGRTKIVAQWNLYCRMRLVDKFPTVKSIKIPRRTPIAWNQEQLVTLFDAIDRIRGHIAGVPAAGWWRALHLVMWDTGERIGALRAIRWDDVDLEAGWLIVRAECRKGQTEDMSWRLHESTLDALRAIVSPVRQLVFPWDRSHCLIWIHYTKLLARAGLPCDRRSKFHRMRKSVLSHAKVAGLNPTEVAGHSDPTITRAYLDPNICGQAQLSDVLFRPDRADTQQPRESPRAPMSVEEPVRPKRSSWSVS